jgi:hypothetical protein
MDEDTKVPVAACVLVVSVLMEIGGAVLVSRGDVLSIIGVVLIGFGIMGLIQAVAISFGWSNPRGGEESDQDARPSDEPPSNR